MKRSLLIAAAIGALLMAPGVVNADDLEDLKNTLIDTRKALSSLDAEAYAKYFHADDVFYGMDMVAPVIGVGGLSDIESMKTWMATFDYMRSNPINIECRIIGNIGIVTFFDLMTSKLKNASPTALFFRGIYVYTKVKGKWLRITGSETRFQKWR